MTDYRTPNGVLHYGGECRDDYRNFVTYDQGGGHTVLTLQRCAMRAFWEAQVQYAKKVGWSDKRLKEEPKGRPISVLPGTNRSCATQARLYKEDPNRYAKPSVTGHTRGIAIDVDQRQGNVSIIHRALMNAGWKQTRPNEEPWHYSYFLSV